MEKITIEGPGPLNPIGKPAIDWTKPVETVRGEKVHIYAIDHNLRLPVLGRLLCDDDITQWSYDGRITDSASSPWDLRNVQEQK